MSKRHILLTPGPIPVPQAVREVLGEPIFHHRTPRFKKIFEDVSARIKKVFMTESPVYTIAGSGTSAMEMAMVNFHKTGDEILVVDGGKFGERFTDLAKAFKLKAHVLKVEWGHGVNPAEIEAALKKNRNIRSVCVQLCETSTAALHDIRAVGKVTEKTDALLIVDAVSGLGADRLETDNWHVDLVIGGSQKALMLPPGLGFLSVSAKARKRVEESDIPKFYLNLKLYEKGLQASDTPFTPAIGLVCALQKAIELIEVEGLENVFRRSAELGNYTRDRLRDIGLELFSKAPSSTVSAAIVPDGVDGGKLIKTLRDEKGVTMAGGQGHMKGKLIRVAHMGSITKADLTEGLQVLADTIQEMKVGA